MRKKAPLLAMVGKGGSGKVFKEEGRIGGRRDSNSSIPKRLLIAGTNINLNGCKRKQPAP